MVGQPAAPHGGPVAAAPLGGAGHGAAVDVDNVAVSQAGEVVDGLAQAAVVGGADDIDVGQPGVAAADFDEGDAFGDAERAVSTPMARSTVV